MHELTAKSEPPRLKRKMPSLETYQYIEKGRTSRIEGVSRIYLEDIERIFAVMEAYLPYSPNVQRRLADYQQHLNRLEEIARQSDTSELAKVSLPAPPTHIILEIPGYEPAVVVEQIRTVPEKEAAEIEMRVGFGDLRLSVDSSRCYVSTNDDSPQASAAFDELVGIVRERINPISAFLLSTNGFFVIAFLPLAPLLLAMFSGNRSFVLFVWPVIMFILVLILWDSYVWRNRKPVILQYSWEAPTMWQRSRIHILTGIAFPLLVYVLLLLIVRGVTGKWPEGLP